MKKIILVTNFIALFFVISASAQSNRKIINDYNDIVKVYQAKNYENASVLLEDFLQKYEGKMPNDVEYYALHLCFESFENVNNYEKALIYVNKTLNFLESGKIKLQDQNKFLSLYKEKKEKFKNILTPKQKEVEVVTKNEISTKTDVQVKEEASKNDGKTVTLTVSGTGKTLEEAKLNALRSAIEQAFGAFISSKTEILNDNLVKDEIVSVASGNVQKYNVVSQVEIPNNGHAITLNATVSIEKLTTFAESKGVEVQFKGGIYGLKLKLQRLNEQAEVSAIKNLTSTCFEILNKSLDFELIVSEPKLTKYDKEESYIDFEIKTKINNNFEQFNKYFLENIKNMSLNKTEVEDYKNINKNVYNLVINGEKFHLRSKESFKLLVNFFISSQILANSFKIYSNESIIKFSYEDIYNFSTYNLISKSQNPKNIFLNAFYYKNTWSYIYEEIYLAPFIKLFEKEMSITKNELLYNIYNLDYHDNSNVLHAGGYLYLNDPDYGERTNDLAYYTVANAPILKFSRIFKNSEIERINQFNIDKIDVYEFVKNRNLYMFPNREKEFSCFIGNTKIKTPTGTKNIQDIKVGDEVICFDDKGNLHTSIVESINEHDNQEVYKYSVWDGDALYATSNHWVLTSENTFSEIGKIDEMLTLVDEKGGLRPITKVEYHGKHKVYNFIVKEHHTYIANGIRVHNGGKGKHNQN